MWTRGKRASPVAGVTGPDAPLNPPPPPPAHTHTHGHG